VEGRLVSLLRVLLSIRVPDLQTYIALKEELGTEKDRAALPVLRRTLQERQRSKQSV